MRQRSLTVNRSQSNQSGIETIKAKGPYRAVIVSQSNQSGIETSMHIYERMNLLLYQSNQSGIETKQYHNPSGLSAPINRTKAELKQFI